MKKSMFLLGMAAVALASCTNEEVMEVPESRIINFSTFLNNTTRATTDIESLQDGDYYVIGYYGESGTLNNPVFTNEVNTTEYYWKAPYTYQFASYSDGKSQLEDVTFTPNNTNPVLTISNYTVNDTKDLLGAISEQITTTQTTGNSAVSLSFKHLLSKVRFTFNTALGSTYELKIEDLKFTAFKTGTVSYNKTTATWKGNAPKAEYVYDDVINDLADEQYRDDNNTFTASVEKFVMPQAVPENGDGSITVTFSATLKGDAVTDDSNGITKTFSATLTVPTDNAWKFNTIYNYTTILKASQFNPDLDEDQQITFTPTVEKWDGPTDIEYTPQAQN